MSHVEIGDPVSQITYKQLKDPWREISWGAEFFIMFRWGIQVYKSVRKASHLLSLQRMMGMSSEDAQGRLLDLVANCAVQLKGMHYLARNAGIDAPRNRVFWLENELSHDSVHWGITVLEVIEEDQVLTSIWQTRFSEVCAMGCALRNTETSARPWRQPKVLAIVSISRP